MLAPIVVAGVFDLFPTTDTASGPVVVMNRDQLAAWAEIAGEVEAPATEHLP